MERWEVEKRKLAEEYAIQLAKLHHRIRMDLGLKASCNIDDLIPALFNIANGTTKIYQAQNVGTIEEGK